VVRTRGLPFRNAAQSPFASATPVAVATDRSDASGEGKAKGNTSRTAAIML
jgi:hypothetical protein